VEGVPRNSVARCLERKRPRRDEVGAARIGQHDIGRDGIHGNAAAHAEADGDVSAQAFVACEQKLTEPSELRVSPLAAQVDGDLCERTGQPAGGRIRSIGPPAPSVPSMRSVPVSPGLRWCGWGGPPAGDATVAARAATGQSRHRSGRTESSPGRASDSGGRRWLRCRGSAGPRRQNAGRWARLRCGGL